jgi:hypothetical protein
MGATATRRLLQERLPSSRKGTSWLNVLKTLTCYRLIDPGSEWRLHWQWWDRSAIGDLLGEDARLAESHKLYRCLDKFMEHKEALFTHRYLLRSNLVGQAPAELWSFYIQLTEVGRSRN